MMTPELFRAWMKRMRFDRYGGQQAAAEALGEIRYGPTPAEISSRDHRRSLYIAEDVAAGEVLTAQNVRSVRPGFGMAPKHLDAVLGKRASRAAPKGTPLAWDLIAD